MRMAIKKKISLQYNIVSLSKLYEFVYKYSLWFPLYLFRSNYSSNIPLEKVEKNVNSLYVRTIIFYPIVHMRCSYREIFFLSIYRHLISI